MADNDVQRSQQALEAEPDNDGNGQTGGTGGTIVLAVIGVIVGIFAFASAVGIVKSTGSTSPGTRMCTTACYGFARLECPGDRLMGACLGFWGCGGPGPHPCGTNPPGTRVWPIDPPGVATAAVTCVTRPGDISLAIPPLRVQGLRAPD